MGRNPGIRKSDIYEIMKNQNRPVWTAKDIGDAGGVSRVTASKRLKEMADDDNLETIEIGNATVYYLAGLQMKPTGDNDATEEDLRRSFEDRFVGLFSAPWTAVPPNDGPALAGDKIQIRVEGRPGDWRRSMTRLYENRRQELQYRETDEKEVQALISGELYEKPTVPIRHVDYPDDYDLEAKIGVKIKGEPPNAALIAIGEKKHLIRPVNDAVYLRDVEVDWICPIGRGQDIERTGVGLRDRDTDADTAQTKIPPEVADIVILSGDCEPRRAYIDEKPLNDGYWVIPADFEGNELGEDYEPTDQFKREVREKTAVDGDLQFERTWLED